MINFIDDIREKITVEQEKYRDNPTPEVFDNLNKLIKLLAQSLLVDKAIAGSVQSVIELNKLYNFTPDELTLDQLLKCKNLSLEQLEAIEKKLEVNGSRFRPCTAKEVFDALEAHEIHYKQAMQALQVIKMKQDIEYAEQSEGKDKIEIFITKDVDGAV